MSERVPPHTSAERPKGAETRETSRGKERFKMPESVQEALQTAADVATERLLKKLDSPDGLRTDFKTYREEIVRVLGEMDARLPENHVLKGTTPLIVENFLTPEERGVDFVRSLVERGYQLAKSERIAPGPKEFDIGTKALRSSLSFAIDLAKTKPEKIPKFVDELKKIPFARDTFARFPDLNTVICEILPKIGKDVDKQTVLSAYDSLVSNVRTEALALAKGEIKSEGDRTRIALKFTNESAKFLQSVLTQSAVKDGVDGITKLEAVKTNPIAAKLLAIVRHPTLSDGDRYELVRKGIDGIELFTQTPPNEGKLERYVNETLAIVAKLKPKLPQTVVNDFVNALFANAEKPKSGGRDIDFWELTKLLAENSSNFVKHRDQVQKAIAEYAKGNVAPMKEVVIFLLEGDVLKENIRLAGGNLVHRIKAVVDLRISEFAQELQKRLGQSVKMEGLKVPEVLPKHGDPLVDGITSRFVASVSDTLFWPNRPPKVTKETLFDRAKGAIEQTVASIPGNSLRIGGASVPKSALLETVRSEPFKEWVMETFSTVADASKGQWAMKKAAEALASVMQNPFSNPRLAPEKRDRAVDSAVNVFYSLPSAEIAKTLAENFGTMGIDRYLRKPDGTPAVGPEDLKTLVDVLRDDRGDGKGPILPKELAKSLIKNHFGPPPDFAGALKEFFGTLSKEDAAFVVERLERSWTLGKLAELGASKAPTGKLTPERASELVDLILMAEGKTDAATRKTLFERFGIQAWAAEFAVTLVKRLGPEKAKALLAAHAETVSSVAENPKEALKSNPSGLAALAADVLYAMDGADLNALLKNAGSFLPSLEGMMKTDVLGKDLSSRIVQIREMVPRESAKAFLMENASELAGLSERFDTATALRLGSKLLPLIPENRLAELAWTDGMGPEGDLLAKALPGIKKVVDSFAKETVELSDGRTVSRLDALLSPVAAAIDGTVSEPDSRLLAGEGFDFFSRLASEMGDGWKLPKTEGPTPPVVDRIKSEMISKNLGFSIGQALPYLFGRPVEDIIRKFLSDPGNKPGFVAAIAPIIRDPNGKGLSPA